MNTKHKTLLVCAISSKSWQAFGDGGISLDRGGHPLCFPPSSFCWRRKREKSLFGCRTYPSFSHLQQQKQQQTRTAMIMRPASTDTVMIKIWKLTGSTDRGNSDENTHLQLRGGYRGYTEDSEALRESLRGESEIGGGGFLQQCWTQNAGLGGKGYSLKLSPSRTRVCR